MEHPQDNLVIGEYAQPAVQYTNWTSNVAGKMVASSILIAEITPLNEAMRLAAFGAALKYGDSASAAVIAGASTFAIEGAAAITTADVLDTKSGGGIIDKVNARFRNMTGNKIPKTGLMAESVLALTGGSAVVTLAKHVQDPHRSRWLNRKYGLTSAAGISVVTTGQAILAAEGIQHISTTELAAGALAVGTVLGAYKWGKNKFSVSEDTESEPKPHRLAPQRLGLSIEDRDQALQNPDVIKICVEDKNTGKKRFEPMLVPLKELYWYNRKYLEEQYDTDKLYYYAHPPIEITQNDNAQQIIESVVHDGGVIVYDTVTSDEEVHGDLFETMANANGMVREKLGGGSQDRYLDQYSGTIQYKDQESLEFKPGKRLFDQYVEAVENGEINFDPSSGPAMVETIEGEDAEKLWDMYDMPFAHLGKEHPINAGFDHKAFMTVLKDPNVVKVVHREEGKVTGLALFVTDFSHCPWLDETYYRDQYPEAFDTENIYIFTGIVTDKEHRAGFHSYSLIKLLMQTARLKDSSSVLTFECGDISAKYVPKGVRLCIWKSGAGKISDIQQPKSRLNYYAIRNREE
ncbi:MAG TPA: hypothetical protein VF575_03545 [Candidatus Saccharimonadales bacterium]|jgi:hypothetical protein